MKTKSGAQRRKKCWLPNWSFGWTVHTSILHFFRCFYWCKLLSSMRTVSNFVRRWHNCFVLGRFDRFSGGWDSSCAAVWVNRGRSVTSLTRIAYFNPFGRLFQGSLLMLTHNYMKIKETQGTVFTRTHLVASDTSISDSHPGLCYRVDKYRNLPVLNDYRKQCPRSCSLGVPLCSQAHCLSVSVKLMPILTLCNFASGYWVFAATRYSLWCLWKEENLAFKRLN